jgi:MYXO-CTERM domain-containing protein
MKAARRLSTKVKRLSLLFALVFGLGLFAASQALATEYYVATTGSDSNPGTLAAPFATLQKGADTAVAGDTVWIRGGTYKITTPKTSGAGIELSKSGTSDTNRIKYWAYPGETPLFDFSNLQISTSGYTFGFVISGSWVHLKGIEECCVPMNSYANNGFASDGTNNIYELLNAHNNQGSGIQIGGGNQAINCDSHDNYDPTSPQGDGQNADGFGVHGQTSGPSTIIRGCRAWWNSDDGYDFINQEVPVTIENSWAFGAGFANYGTTRPSSGNGNGFKMGSSKTGIRHLIQNNVAWGNKANGFYANHSSGGNTWYNNTSFQNGTQYNMLASTWSEPNGKGTRTDGVKLTGDKAHILRNNVGYPNKNEYMDAATYGVDSQFNAWDLNITPKASDFLSITDPSVSGTGQAIETTSPALGPRQADGSLPNVDFLKLAAGSQMIDKGTNVQLPFVGAAPDLGAYEYGATGGTPTGGVTGAGGTTATGGATGAAGATGTGGKSGSGGTTGTVGKTGSGGATTATGGKTASSSAPGAGGSLATGGVTLLGGTPGIGGDTGAGGVTETGGTSGVVDTGGAVAPGGAENGGSAVIGGVIATGGVPGGAGVTAPVETGGAVVTGGTPQPGSTGGTTTSTEAGQTSSGCSCRIAGRQATGSTGFALLGLLVFALRLRRRR